MFDRVRRPRGQGRKPGRGGAGGQISENFPRHDGVRNRDNKQIVGLHCLLVRINVPNLNAIAP